MAAPQNKPWAIAIGEPQQTTFTQVSPTPSAEPSPSPVIRSRSNAKTREAKIAKALKDEPNPFENVSDIQTPGINFDNYGTIPVEVTASGEIPDPVKTFEESELPQRVKQNITLAGFSKPTPIQQYSIPYGSSGLDLMCTSQTGSGKTAAFLLPTINTLLKTPRPQINSSAYACPRALCIAPTRELCKQIHEQAQKFSWKTNNLCRCIFGGTPVSEQKYLISSGCDILTATPGRLVDFCERGYVDLSYVEFLVLDEADRMLELGFEEDIKYILNRTPETDIRQTFMFSATFPQNIQQLAMDYLKPDYVHISVGSVGTTSGNIEQIFRNVREDDKPYALVEEIRKAPSGSLILVFVEKKVAAEDLYYILQDNQIESIYIHGDLTQGQRDIALSYFKSGERAVLIGTDVVQRGIDIPNVSHVINYDFPKEIQHYVHRVGRTGRAGNVGVSISFINENNSSIIPALINQLNDSKVPVPDWMRLLNVSSARPSRHNSAAPSRRNSQYGSKSPSNRSTTSHKVGHGSSRQSQSNADSWDGW